ncbi:Probable phenylalanine--tRNA ligase, mitochondrial [Gryllus bimaculatus]|nr:Probable phenylalanine--tRNA ligase, mitochondrial [Gryllus bimaculatus]
MIFERRAIITSVLNLRHLSSNAKSKDIPHTAIGGCHYPHDDWTNVSTKILSYVGRNIHLQNNHPLSLIRQRIVQFFHKTFIGRTGNAVFSIYDNLNPIVTVEENFDSLLIPVDHPSRKKSDCYYLNQNHLLRAHTTAHQARLMSMGLNNFLIVGDVYRRDEIDSTHYPVFHQVDAVRLRTAQDLFPLDASILSVFDKGVERTEETQEHYNKEISCLMINEMKKTLEMMASELFGKDVKTRWVSAYFPFTHPSFELEILHHDKWMEVLGCGLIEQKILKTAGAVNHIGWAFGLGLERLAMHLYEIPDIRLFWSEDLGFLSQFNVEDPRTPIKYKPVSIYPPCSNDISFWLPQDAPFASNDFYDLVRNIGGDLIEQVNLIDEFTSPKKKMTSHCYRIVYRHMERTLTQEEVNVIHKDIEKTAVNELKVTIR